MRGIAYGFKLDYSLSEQWAPYARRAIERIDRKNKKLLLAIDDEAA